MEHSANRTDRDKIVTAVVDALVKGESQENLFSALRTRSDAPTAQQILNDAMKEYEALKTSGRIADYEHNLYFERSKTRSTKKDIAGFSLILVGVGASALSYLTAAMSAMPGQKYFVFFGLIAVGIYILVFSDHTIDK
ncbi:MAG: hypothetical protein WA743_02345 [Pseudolabrys sp.]